MKNKILSLFLLIGSFSNLLCKPTSYRQHDNINKPNGETTSSTLTSNNNFTSNDDTEAISHTSTNTDNQNLTQAQEAYQACLQISTAICEANKKCLHFFQNCDQSAQNLCLSMPTDLLEIEIDHESLNQCLADLFDVNCSEWNNRNRISVPPLTLSKCHLAIKGKKHVGEYCQLPRECVFINTNQNIHWCDFINECHDGYCFTDIKNTQCSRCISFSHERDACNETLPCHYHNRVSKPLICSPFGQCLYWQAEENQACEVSSHNCKENMFCDDTLEMPVCKPLPQERKPCQNGLCQSSAFCNDDNLCIAKEILFEGDNCSDNLAHCNIGLYCDTITQICVKQKVEGDSCVENFECKQALFCKSDNTQQKCSRPIAVDDSCESDISCLAGFGWCKLDETNQTYLCNDGQFPSQDEPCGKNKECAVGFYCDETLSAELDYVYICQKKKDIGEICDSDKQCISNQCKEKICSKDNNCKH